MSAIFTKPVNQPLTLPLVPDSAPFNEAQRSWLNGFLAGWLGINAALESNALSAGMSAAMAQLDTNTAVAPEVADEPWHDPELAIDERLELAADRPLADKLMASMAQLDCGACGYVCRTYSNAIAAGDEKNLTLCSPGGKLTAVSLKKLVQSGDKTSVAAKQATNASAAPAALPGQHRDHPCSATLKRKRTLNGSGSKKITTHVEIDISGTPIEYRVGDSLGVYPRNCPELVTELLAVLDATADERVTLRSGTVLSLGEALAQFDLRYVSDELLELLKERTTDATQHTALANMIEEGTDFDVLDVLQFATGATFSASDICQTLSPLQPRLYSISSSPRAHR
ncbi:MAG: sulfite reductase subunit alpha, partial [Planctomycetales bacterium]|nr:sulfite reductase subunit alpha [Planctomycetales bacterium]